MASFFYSVRAQAAHATRRSQHRAYSTPSAAIMLTYSATEMDDRSLERPRLPLPVLVINQGLKGYRF